MDARGLGGVGQTMERDEQDGGLGAGKEVSKMRRMKAAAMDKRALCATSSRLSSPMWRNSSHHALKKGNWTYRRLGWSRSQ